MDIIKPLYQITEVTGHKHLFKENVQKWRKSFPVSTRAKHIVGNRILVHLMWYENWATAKDSLPSAVRLAEGSSQLTHARHVFPLGDY